MALSFSIDRLVEYTDSHSAEKLDPNPQECPVNKSSDGEAAVLKFLGMGSIFFHCH